MDFEEIWCTVKLFYKVRVIWFWWWYGFWNLVIFWVDSTQKWISFWKKKKMPYSFIILQNWSYFGGDLGQDLEPDHFLDEHYSKYSVNFDLVLCRASLSEHVHKTLLSTIFWTNTTHNYITTTQTQLLTDLDVIWHTASLYYEGQMIWFWGWARSWCQSVSMQPLG